MQNGNLGNLNESSQKLVAQMVENPPATQETRVQSLSREDPQRKEWLPVPVFMPGEVHGERSLAGCSSWGCRVGHN